MGNRRWGAVLHLFAGGGDGRIRGELGAFEHVFGVGEGRDGVVVRQVLPYVSASIPSEKSHPCNHGTNSIERRG